MEWRCNKMDWCCDSSDSGERKAIKISFWILALGCNSLNAIVQTWGFYIAGQVTDFIRIHPDNISFVESEFATKYILSVWILPFLIDALGLVCILYTTYLAKIHDIYDGWSCINVSSYLVYCVSAVVPRVFLWMNPTACFVLMLVTAFTLTWSFLVNMKILEYVRENLNLVDSVDEEPLISSRESV